MNISLISTLKNLNTNEIQRNKTIAKKNKNKITYKIDDFNYILKIISPNSLILNRNNQEIECTLHFESQKTNSITYTIKEEGYNLEIEMKTNFLKIENQKIEIHYNIIDSNTNYEYYIEMSEIK